MRFGVFELDLATGQLRKSGIRIRLQTKSFQILEALLEKPGQIVSREDLRNRLWQEETYGAFDTGLNTAINRLRSALGDSAEKPVYIETVARTGYRFIAPVLSGIGEAPLAGVPAASPQATRMNSVRLLRIAGAAFCLALLCAAAIAALFWPKPLEATFRQITFQRGNVYGARFTPDGQNVLYAAEWEGRPKTLFLTLPASPESRNLGFSGTSLASVSSRGELALLTSGGTMNIAGGKLSRVPMNGGSPVDVARNIMSADWSPDGTALLVVRAVQGQNWLEFPVGKVLYRTSGWLSSGRLSSDGRSIAFIDHPVRHDDAGSIVVIDTSGTVRARSRDWDSASGLAWHPRTHEVWFTAARRGSLRGVWAWQTPGRLRPIAQSPGILTLRDIAPDGRVLVSRDVRRLEMAGRIGGRAEDRTLTWLDWSRVQEVSPDGSLVLFDEGGEGAGPQNIVYIYRTNDASAARVGEGRAMSLAPDLHRVLTLGSRDRKHFRLIAIDSQDVVDVPDVGLEYQWGRFSPDGKRLLALANAPGKGLRLYIQNIDGGSAPVPITPEMAVRNVAISPDGDEVAVLKGNGELTIYPAKPGVNEPRIIASGEPLAPIHWSRDKHHIFVEHLRATTDLPARLSRIDVRTGRLEFWHEIAPVDPVGVTAVTGVAISGDEQSYVYSYRRLMSELFIAEGWK